MKMKLACSVILNGFNRLSMKSHTERIMDGIHNVER